MKKIFGLAALTGIVAGAAYYLKKTGILNLSEEEDEDGSLKYGVQIKLPDAPVYEDEDGEILDEEEVAEAETEEQEVAESEDEETEEDTERQLSFYVTVGPEARAKLNNAKESMLQFGDAVLQKAVELKDIAVDAVKERISPCCNDEDCCEESEEAENLALEEENTETEE